MDCCNFRYIRLCQAAVCLLGLSASTSTVLAEDRWPTARAEPWPAADALFRRDPRWRGGDGAGSVDLGNSRVLWLFGDSFVSNTPVDQRRGTRMVNNTVGIQTGYDPVTATFKGYWQADTDQPQAFFQPTDNTWYWPASGVMVDGQLLIVLMKIRKSDQGMGFAFFGSAALMIENPQESPEHWRTIEVEVPDNRLEIIYGSGGMTVEKDYLVSLAPHAGKWHRAYLIRWSLADVRRGDLTQPQLWVGDRWQRQSEVEELPEPILPTAQSEFTTHFDERVGGLLQVQCSYLTQSVGLRFARRRTDPWVSVPNLFTPAPRDQVFYYAGKAHPELQANGLAVTYCCNGRRLGAVVADESIYYPRFLQVRFDAQ